MTPSAIEHVIECQSALIGAIDAGDLPAIEESTRLLAIAVQRARSGDVVTDEKLSLEHALKQANALTIRVNTLSDWTRQRIDRLAQLRGETCQHTYSRHGKTSLF